MTKLGKQDGRAFVGYCNDTPHYLFRKHKLNGEWHFDIENENLIYSDCSSTHHGLQCNYYEGDEQGAFKYQKIMELCDKMVELMKEVDKLNTL